MDEETKLKIELGVQEASTFAKETLDFLEKAFPAIEKIGGPVGAGLGILQTIVLPLIEKIPTGDVVSIEEQRVLYERANSLYNGSAFSGPQWKSRSKPAEPQASDTGTGETKTD